MDYEHIIKLERFQGGKEIKIREPKVRDIKATESHSKDSEEKELFLISNLTGLTHDELMDMYFSDYKKIQEKLQSFLV